MLSFIDLSKEKYSCYGNVTGGSDGRECVCSAGDWVRSLDQEDPLEKGMATHFSILAWRIPWTGAWWTTVHGVAESDITEQLTFSWKCN